jgi:murein L,D-transpeptidase YcbB/YkuD
MSSSAPVRSPITGQDLVELARQHVGEKYVLGVLVPKDNTNWKGPWDCAEFASWVTFQMAAKLYGCDNDLGNPATADAFTGYWNRDATKLGQIISLEQASATPGAFVLRVPAPGAIGHVVLSDGKGGTVEAHSSRDGVIASTLAKRRWDMGILVPGVQYSSGPPATIPPPAVTIYRLTNPLMTGDPVRKIQQALKAAGFDPGVIDGEFGPHTSAAVVAFQLASGLIADGEVGPTTAKPLNLQL